MKSSLSRLRHKPALLSPSGATPQRRQFSYPKQLVKSQSRGELLDSLRRQQEELLAAMEEEEEEEEDRHSQVEHVRSPFSSSVTVTRLHRWRFLV